MAPVVEQRKEITVGNREPGKTPFSPPQTGGAPWTGSRNPTPAGPAPAASPAHSGIRPMANTAPSGIPGANDPTYLAYMREMGIDEANVNILTGHRVNSLTRQLGRALPAYADKRKEAIRGAGYAAEDRGMFASGLRMRDQTEAARDVDRERLDFEAQIRDSIGEIYMTSAMDIAQLRRQLMEQGLSAAQANAIANAEAGI